MKVFRSSLLLWRRLGREIEMKSRKGDVTRLTVLKALRDKIGGRAGRDLDEAHRNETDSATAPIATDPLDPVSATVVDEIVAGFPPELR
jgi:hypothetical protein